MCDAFASIASSRVKLSCLSVALGALLLTVPQPALAVNKETVQLQTQVQQLQDAVARLQQSNDERMGVLKDLVQQTADSVNKMSVSVGTMQRQLAAQGESQTAKSDQVSGQVQSLNDALDEMKARLQRIEKSLGDLQNTQQSLAARTDAGPAAPVSATTNFPADNGAGGGAVKAGKSQRPAPPPGFPSDGTESPAPSAANTAAAPPVKDLYQTAYGDFNGAKYDLASAEFNDVIRYYPESPLAGNAYFYLGEILYKQQQYGPATRKYDKVIEQYPGNPKIPAAELRKGQALLAYKQTDAGVKELRSLIQRYPNSPEATSARAKLNELGVRINPAR